MLQNSEEERLIKLKEKLKLFFVKNQEMSANRKDFAEKCEKRMDIISPEAEVKQIIVKIASKTGMIEEIVDIKPACKSVDIFLKYKDAIKKSGSPAFFTYEDAKLSPALLIQEDFALKSEEILNKIKEFLTNCWNSNEIHPIAREEINEILKDPKTHKIFIECLNYFRTQGLISLTEIAYKSLSNSLNQALDKFALSDSVECALTLLILSETFYTEKGMELIYLQREIKRHPYFQNQTFWEKAIKIPGNDNIFGLKFNEEVKNDKLNKEQLDDYKKAAIFIHLMQNLYFPQSFIELIAIGYGKQKMLPENALGILQVTYILKKNF